MSRTLSETPTSSGANEIFSESSNTPRCTPARCVWNTPETSPNDACDNELLYALQCDDPAVLLLRREDAPDPLALTRHSYSQASAYVVLLCRFDWDAEELAEHLRIVEHTLLARLRWFGAWTRWQASLFDGLQTIALDFEPAKARSLASPLHEATARTDPQLAWNFAAPPGQHS